MKKIIIFPIFLLLVLPVFAAYGTGDYGSGSYGGDVSGISITLKLGEKDIYIFNPIGINCTASGSSITSVRIEVDSHVICSDTNSTGAATLACMNIVYPYTYGDVEKNYTVSCTATDLSNNTATQYDSFYARKLGGGGPSGGGGSGGVIKNITKQNGTIIVNVTLENKTVYRNITYPVNIPSLPSVIDQQLNKTFGEENVPFIYKTISDAIENLAEAVNEQNLPEILSSIITEAKTPRYNIIFLLLLIVFIQYVLYRIARRKRRK